MTSTVEIVFAGQRLLLDAQGALVWPEGNALVVSDLHLEKASFLAQSGAPVPRYDTLHTLERLQTLIEQYRPQRLICLGDSFHDAKAFSRLLPADRERLGALIAMVEEWQWVLGNHDPVLAETLPGSRQASLVLGNICLLHEPEENSAAQIVGHFHPKTTLRVSGQRVSGKSFIHDNKLLIMPAFGSYTGGLDVTDQAIQRLFTTSVHYLIYRRRLWKMT